MMPFRIGADASCTDGACGQVSRIIVNPVTREVTHLAVDPKPRHGRKKVRWVVVGTPGSGVGVFARPSAPEAPQQVTVDSVPSGEVGIHRGLTVCATDGEIGQVQGLIVEPGGHQVTHVLLQKGHMPGRKDVAIPIGAVTKIGTLIIHLSLTRHQVKDLPPVEI